MPACAGWTALDFLIPHGGSQARLTPAGGWRLHRFASVPRLVEPGCSGSRLAGKAGQSDTGGGFVAALRPVRIRGQASNRSIDSHQIAWSRPGGRRLPGSMQHKPRRQGLRSPSGLAGRKPARVQLPATRARRPRACGSGDSPVRRRDGRSARCPTAWPRLGV